jgi:hypothetical protein
MMVFCLMHALFHSNDNFVVDLKQIGLCSVDEIQLTQDRIQWQVIMNTITNYWVFVLRPSPGILESRLRDVSETGS